MTDQMERKATRHRTITLEAWKAEGVLRFGSEQIHWKFQCPVCGVVSAALDWKAAGAPVGAVGFACVGRWLDTKRRAFGESQATVSQPCDYSGGGLFGLNPVTVQAPDGTEVCLFDFAPAEAARSIAGCRKPCAECPYSRTTSPGCTGGSHPAVFVGQAAGPFLLSCHMDPAYKADPRSTALLQCAGAATFRANMGWSGMMPASLLALPADTQAVFASPAELIAHHQECSVERAEQFMRFFPVVELARAELAKQEVKVVRIEQKATP